MWNPNLVYLGGSTSFVDNVDPNRLSYFEIQDICFNVGAVSTSNCGEIGQMGWHWGWVGAGLTAGL